jgi:hypothetical protein
VNEGEFVKFNVETVDEDRDTITYTFSAPLDGKGEWQTTYEDAGTYNIYVTAWDGISNTTEIVTLVVHDVNRAPDIQVSDILVDEGETAKIQANVSDIDRDLVTVTYPEPFDENGEWQTSFDDAGIYKITVTASDGELTAEKDVSIMVNDVNQLPVVRIKPSDNVEINETDSIALEIEAEDPDSDSLAYAWYRNGQIISENSDFAFITDFDSAGTYNFIAVVYDKEGKVETPVQITVRDLNRIPAFEVSDVIVVKETEGISLSLPEKDADQQSLSYQISEPIGNDMFWQTTYEDSGEYNIEITASDGESQVTKTIKVIVEDVDRAPEVTDIEADVNEAEELEIELSAEDPDGDAITYSIIEGPEDMNLNGNTITWTPDYDFIKIKHSWLKKFLFRHNLGSLNHNISRGIDVLVEARGKNLSSNISIFVTVWNTNQQPLLKQIDDIEIKEGETIRLSPVAEDPDLDPLIVKYSGFISSDAYETTYDDAGQYIVTVTVSDGKDETSQNVSIKIENTNREPQLVTKELVFAEGTESKIRLQAFDPDGDAIEINYIDIPEGAEFKNDKLVWEPDYGFVQHEAVGWLESTKAKLLGYNREVTGTFVLDDGEVEVEQDLIIIVEDVNRAPELEKIKSITAKENETLNIPVDAYDPDNDTLKFKFKGLVKENNQTLGFDDAGRHDVKVIVSDGEWKKSQIVPVTVLNTNRAPDLNIKTVRIRENQILKLELNGIDLEGDSIEYTMIEGPEDAVIEGDKLVWEPGYDIVQHTDAQIDSGILSVFWGTELSKEIPVRLILSDGKLNNTVEFEIEVIDVNRPPVIVQQSPFPEFTTFAGNLVNFTVTAEDPDGDALTYTWKVGTFEKYEGGSEHTRKVINPGIKEIAVEVSDGRETAEAEWRYAVNSYAVQTAQSVQLSQ